jgi:hypothetical protein
MNAERLALSEFSVRTILILLTWSKGIISSKTASDRSSRKLKSSINRMNGHFLISWEIIPLVSSIILPAGDKRKFLILLIRSFEIQLYIFLLYRSFEIKSLIKSIPYRVFEDSRKIVPSLSSANRVNTAVLPEPSAPLITNISPPE